MGNFSGKLNNSKTRETAILKLTLQKDSKGKVFLANDTFIPCYMKDNSSEGSMVIIPEGYKTTDKDFQKELKLLNKQEDRAFDVEASCAAAVYKLDSFSTIEECVQKSDEAMYQVKEKHHKHRKD